MCGIVGYVGTKRQAYPILIKGLKRLEYRGYDSAGVALINPDGVLSVDKENYAEIKARLEEKGVRFRSDTDTEVLVQLIEYIQERKQIELLPAVQLALHQVVGAYAIALLDSRHPDTIIAARKQSPLVVGIGEGEVYRQGRLSRGRQHRRDESRRGVADRQYI